MFKKLFNLFKRLLGSEKENKQYLITPQTQSLTYRQKSYDAFKLGICIEEFYIIFGEQLQNLMEGSLPETYYEAFERKARIIRETLVAFNVSDDILTSLMRLETNVRQDSIDSQVQVDFEIESSKSREIAEDIDSLMYQVRQQLSDIQGVQYDLGVLAARICFCSNFVLACIIFPEEDPQEELTQMKSMYKSLYMEELIRAGNRLGDILESGDQTQTLSAAIEPAYQERLFTIATSLTNKTSISDETVGEIHQTVEKLLAYVGLTQVPKTFYI